MFPKETFFHNIEDKNGNFVSYEIVRFHPAEI